MASIVTVQPRRSSKAKSAGMAGISLLLSSTFSWPNTRRFWLAQALAMADRVERAREVFESAVRYVNDVGLLAEEIDPETGELLGNFPQAFSHIGLVNAAWAISEAELRAGGTADQVGDTAVPFQREAVKDAGTEVGGRR